MARRTRTRSRRKQSNKSKRKRTMSRRTPIGKRKSSVFNQFAGQIFRQELMRRMSSTLGLDGGNIVGYFDKIFKILETLSSSFNKVSGKIKQEHIYVLVLTVLILGVAIYTDVIKWEQVKPWIPNPMKMFSNEGSGTVLKSSEQPNPTQDATQVQPEAVKVPSEAGQEAEQSRRSMYYDRLFRR